MEKKNNLQGEKGGTSDEFDLSDSGGERRKEPANEDS